MSPRQKTADLAGMDVLLRDAFGTLPEYGSGDSTSVEQIRGRRQNDAFGGAVPGENVGHFFVL
ncbi:hypothetical protein AC579_3917 [Pseudocercospora musae]|uniref:Uncharacterized protein n=1 Tax=Pseudocercospora musae TaxID=113226 RepID=A0A139H9W5_9PEZI|nr:hypothetical protein AC579_3917 [Pseudocercospora musae]